MRLLRIKMTTRRWMIAVVVAAAPLTARDRVLEAYGAYRFHQGRDTCDVTGVITGIDLALHLARCRSSSPRELTLMRPDAPRSRGGER
jgi:hypothetical protein